MDELLLHFMSVKDSFGKLQSMEGTNLREVVTNFKERIYAFLHSITIECNISASLVSQEHLVVATTCWEVINKEFV